MITSDLEKTLFGFVVDTVERQALSAIKKIFVRLTPAQQETVLTNLRRRIDRQESIARDILEVCKAGEPYGAYVFIQERYDRERWEVSRLRNNIIDTMAQSSVLEMAVMFGENEDMDSLLLISHGLQMPAIAKNPRWFKK